MRSFAIRVAKSSFYLISELFNSTSRGALFKRVAAVMTVITVRAVSVRGTVKGLVNNSPKIKLIKKTGVKIALFLLPKR